MTDRRGQSTEDPRPGSTQEAAEILSGDPALGGDTASGGAADEDAMTDDDARTHDTSPVGEVRDS